MDVFHLLPRTARPGSEQCFLRGSCEVNHDDRTMSNTRSTLVSDYKYEYTCVREKWFCFRNADCLQRLQWSIYSPRLKLL
jgi:hypothetical protein